VLLVDDHPDVLDMLSALLERQGYRVVALADPAAALRLDEWFAPAVAILDLGLPGMDGYELARALRQRPGFRDTRMLALSGYGQAEDRVRSQAAGFAGHLVKPVGGPELLAAIGPAAALPGEGPVPAQ
jgi:CheY-like chemotaxis protein